jgi:hypothetical protein
VKQVGQGECPLSDQLPALVNGHLPENETARLRSHLAGCAICEAQEAQYRRLVTTLQALPPLAVPPGLRERVLAHAAAQREAGQVKVRRLRLGVALAATLLLAAVWAGVGLLGRRVQGLTPEEWLRSVRITADRAYSVRVLGWIETPRGRIPVEAARVANTLRKRVGDRIQGRADQGPTLLLATWNGEAGRFAYGESLLLLAAPAARPTGPPYFHSRGPLVIAIPHTGALVERVGIDPATGHVQRAELVGQDDRPRAVLERIDYNQFSAPGVPAPAPGFR